MLATDEARPVKIRLATRAEPVALSICATAESCGISKSTLYSLINSGRGPRVMRVGRRRVIMIADRDSWLRSHAEVA